MITILTFPFRLVFWLVATIVKLIWWVPKTVLRVVWFFPKTVFRSVRALGITGLLALGLGIGVGYLLASRRSPSSL
jgi:hypothetical protein